MVIPTREALVAYLLVRAATLRRPPDVAPAIAERLAHARALDLPVEVVRALPRRRRAPADAGHTVVRGGQFAPGAGTDHALNQFVGGSREACETFLSRLVGIAQDDPIAQARAGGHLPPWPR